MQKDCSASMQQSPRLSSSSSLTSHSCSRKPQMPSNSSSERDSISGPVQVAPVKMSILFFLASAQEEEKLRLVISKPWVTMAWTVMVLSAPFLVMQMETSFISPWLSSSDSCSPFFSSPLSLKLEGDLMLDSNLTWQLPVVLLSSTRTSSRVMLHPFSVNLLVCSERSVRFYSSAVISSSRDLLKLEGTFSIFLEKENKGVARRPAEETLLLIA